MLQKRCKKFRLSKTKIAGSIGKSTTIASSDVDSIIFLHVNVKQQGLDDEKLDAFLFNALEDFKKVLTSYNIRYAIENVSQTVFSLKFTVRNIKFDLLPAIDFVGNGKGISDRASSQQQLTLDVMKQNLKRNVYRFSSSLSFVTVNFMKKQTPFAHGMARLAKIWYKSACIVDHVSGASYFMELVAVFVVNQIQMANQNYRDAFCSILNQMINFERINIVFADEYRHLIGHRPDNNEPLPRIIDPSNPYNNLGKHFVKKPNVIAAVKVHAQKTLQNLQELISTPQLELYHSIDLFDPFLLRGVKTFVLSPKYNKKAIQRLKDVEIRLKVDSHDRKKIEFIHLCFSAVVNRLEGRYGPDNLGIIIEALVEILTKQLKATSTLAIDCYSHDEFDASVWLKTRKSGAIRFSFDLDPHEVVGNEKKKAKKQIYSRKTKAELTAMNTNTSRCFFI